ncbi:hypothetical protein [Defluviimonas sp. WL0075]|uniref:Transmembrane protein PGPGW n=1 Tax=Albidovulum sediminicola TaxID=2984331 RepID=A0ABT2Z2E3_9RHOB|nr:hypothetical protein [Defluviimonas sp. WL0075]MCV2865320.1 hypothetical protein [Defluviimonas sp. WL0075]
MSLAAKIRDRWKRWKPRFKRLLAQVNRKVPPGVRLVLGLLLIAGGILGFLPVLGFWMIPLGLGIVWLDIRALRRAGRDSGPDNRRR